MADALTAFPSDGYTARWRTWDHDHLETVTLRWENEGWTVTGEVGREAVTYVLRLSATWQIRQFLLFRDLDEPDLWLGTDGAGRWGEVNGSHRHELTGCTDLALAVTPFTDAVAVRRLQLDVGDSAEVVVAAVDVDTLGVEALRRRYRRISTRRFERTELDSGADADAALDVDAGVDAGVVAGVAVEFDVDEFGLVHDIAEHFRRL